MDRPVVIIAGGSLAGMAAALRLQQHGINALVIEKSQFPRRKLCGEFLGPDSFDSLMALGLWDAVYQAAYGPIEDVIFHPYNQQVGKPLTIPMAWLNPDKPFGLGITRLVLDDLLMSHAKAQGIAILENHKVAAISQSESDLFEVLVCSSDETEEHFKAHIFIDASGRHGGLFLSTPELLKAPQKQIKPKKPALNPVGFKVNVQLAQPSDLKTLQMFFFPGGYGGIQPLSPEIHNICFLTSQPKISHLNQPFSEFIAQTLGQNEVARSLLQDAEAMEPILTTANLNLTIDDSRPSPLIQVGDSMVTIDPFTGSGMALALQTGILAADTIVEGVQQNGSYSQIQQLYWKRYQRLYGLRLAVLKRFRPFLFSQAAQRLAWPLAKPCLPTLSKFFR